MLPGLCVLRLHTTSTTQTNRKEAMRIQLIDVDGHNFPNLPLMKISAWHKEKGDSVEWYDPLTAWINPPDKVYMSKVFTFTPDYPHPVCAMEIIKGGTGYEYPSGGKLLPSEIEHIYPDYNLYSRIMQRYRLWLSYKRMSSGLRFLHSRAQRGTM